MDQQPNTQGRGIASMVCGILSVVLPFPYAGLVLAIVAIALASGVLKATAPNVVGSGRGMAIAGLVCGIVGAVEGVGMTSLMMCSCVW